MMAKPFTIFAHECKQIPDFARRLEGAAEDSENFDMVQRPQHYCKGGIECIEAIKAATANLKGFEAVCAANVIKYVWRYKHKNGLEDIKKAKRYLEWLEEEVSKNEVSSDVEKERHSR